MTNEQIAQKYTRSRARYISALKALANAAADEAMVLEGTDFAPRAAFEAHLANLLKELHATQTLADLMREIG